jgi:4'-phosphopantetheinyl transferase
MGSIIYWTLAESGPAMVNWLGGEGLDFLSPLEQERLAGLRFERRRAEWLLGRWTAKQLITASRPELTGLPLNKISILNSPSGVPYACVDKDTELPGSLSISHRDGLAACAWSNEAAEPVGIDLDLVEHRDESFLSDYFTAGEQVFTRVLPEHLRDLWITLAWSAKEAVLKVLGVGLRMDTRRVEIRNARSLFKPEAAEIEWKTVSVACAEREAGGWHSWWRKCGEFVLTLAVWSQSEHVELIHYKQTG